MVAAAGSCRIGRKPLFPAARLPIFRRAAGYTRQVPEQEQRLERAFGLTRREAEVLGLVARGYTNREIAAELVISVKTADHHVAHTLRKPGAPNRHEADAIAHRLAPLLDTSSQ